MRMLLLDFLQWNVWIVDFNDIRYLSDGLNIIIFNESLIIKIILS